MTNDMKKMNNAELNEVNGGVDGMVGLYDGEYRTVHGLQTGWLALRSDPSYDSRNEIGQLYNGDKVKIIGNDAVTDRDFDKAPTTHYTWVYSPKLNKSGWVNSRFI